MATKSPYQLPTQYHYDVWAIYNRSAEFYCSCAKEFEAIDIAQALARNQQFSGVKYAVRTRPTKAHFIYKFETEF